MPAASLALAAPLPTDPDARRFLAGVLLAFLPAVVAGVVLHGFIKTVLFETPPLVATMMILGGIVLLWVDRRPERPRYDDAMDFPLPMAFKVGLFQCLALVPGVSRSGATIVGALLLGASKRSAAEFSFFLSMPTMAGAFAYDLYKNRHVLTLDDAALIAIGFVCAFLAAVLVVSRLLDFVSRRGYAVFGWWRIAVGGAALWRCWPGDSSRLSDLICRSFISLRLRLRNFPKKGQHVCLFLRNGIEIEA